MSKQNIIYFHVKTIGSHLISIPLDTLGIILHILHLSLVELHVTVFHDIDNHHDL